MLAAACSGGEQGVMQMQAGDAAISLEEGPCLGTCPVYGMTLHPNGAYILNGERFVNTSGVSEGRLGKKAWTQAETILTDANFWSLKAVQTMETMEGCHTDAPTVKVMWRTVEGKEKTVTYNAGCGVHEMQDLVSKLREAMGFGDLVWTDDQFRPDGTR